MTNNRELNGLPWKEYEPECWIAETRHFKCLAIPKPIETRHSNGFGACYTYDALVYRWVEEEEAWVLVERGLFGSEGAQKARVDAERLLGDYLERKAKSDNPSQLLADKLFHEYVAKQMVVRRDRA